MVRKGVILAIILLCIVSSIPLISMGRNVTMGTQNVVSHHERSKESWYVQPTQNQPTENEVHSPEIINEEPTGVTGGLIDSPWPMQSHDIRHTGLSPYSTAENPSTEKWRFKCEREIEFSSAILNNNTIFFGSKDRYLRALYLNGTMKWMYKSDGMIWSSPAVAEDGTIYVGDWNHYLHAVTPYGTRKWVFDANDGVDSSITIAPDGTIYFGDDNKNVYAVNPNGTEKWHYTTGDFVSSTPAIGNDGTIYVGSGDHYLYAFYFNGTVLWKFGTGDWIKGNPTIADDGTIYVPSFDGYLYALNSNGTMNWRVTTGNSIAAAGVALASDGTIYVGTERLRAYYPNGTLKWSLDVNGDIYGTTPAVSGDGTIYVSAGLSLVAVNPNGSIKWQHQICTLNAWSSPCIGADGTVYVGSTWSGSTGHPLYGYLHAFGPGEPKKIEIQQPEPGKLYLFGKDLGTAPKNNTLVIGSVKVKINVSSADQLQSLHFYADGIDEYNTTTPPFEWKLNHRYGKWPLMRHTITVTAYYKGGCSWTESIPVWYFHLLKI